MAPSNSKARDTQSQKPSRKRSPKACLSCRSRKVRCDVFFGGTPCTNCSLDDRSCVVVGRAFNLRRLTKGPLAPSRQMSDQPEGLPPVSNASMETSLQNMSAPEYPTEQNSLSGESCGVEETATEEMCINADDENSANRPKNNEVYGSTFVVDAARPPKNGEGYRNVGGGTPSSSYHPTAGYIPGISRTVFNGDVTYSCYRFLAVTQIHRMPSECVNFLEARGCFRVPISPILDVFLREYFLHVHPLLPILNEGEFWDIYNYEPETDEEGVARNQGIIPLAVLQAMMLASCSFVPPETIRCLGLPSARAARRAFYERTRLLFHLQSESSPLYLSQVALLLSYWSPPFQEAASKHNSTWLRIAIEQAEKAGAHQRTLAQCLPRPESRKEAREHNLLRRLWCCCIVRDRILSFCLRRNIQISQAHFDLDDLAAFSPDEMHDEVNRSKVYNPQVKKSLIEVFTQLAEMCRLMTDAGSLVFPFDKGIGWDKLANAEDAARVKKTKFALRQWYMEASDKLLLPSELRYPESPGHRELHDAVTLFGSLVFIYYHSSIVAICHFQMLQSAIASLAAATTSKFESLNHHAGELRDAASRITECFGKLSRNKLHGFLPTTAIACTALPLVLHTLGSRASSKSSNNQLDVLLQLMTMYESQYDGVEWVGETIRHILESSDSKNMGLLASGAPEVAPLSRFCMESLVSEPSFYLKVAITMDLSLSKGRLPRAADFPTRIKEFFQLAPNPNDARASEQGLRKCNAREYNKAQKALCERQPSKPLAEKAAACNDISRELCLQPRTFCSATDDSTIDPSALILPEPEGIPAVDQVRLLHLNEHMPAAAPQNNWSGDPEDTSGAVESESLDTFHLREDERDLQFLFSWLANDGGNQT